ncbi:MAG: hypothetical protein EOO90_13130 [Pedobacter sp.]|nr:MAG: hypothetical protein EOO90_13130 [Pedobacter sp.]
MALFLSKLDIRIQTQSKIINNLESLINNLTKKLISQQLRFNDNDGHNYPNWKKKKLREIFTIGSGKDYKHLVNGNVPVFGTGGLMTYVDGFLYDGETVCIGRKGTIDKPMYYNGKIWTVDTLFYTHSFTESVPRFIYHTFRVINWKEYNEASGVPSLSKTTIEKIEISIPCFQEQTKIAGFLSTIDEKINIEKQLLLTYQTQKSYLLDKLFI